MRSVIEEKTTRIIEVIVSSVKPFQIMMGKILGVASVALTQFFIWIVFTLLIVTVAGSALGLNDAAQTMAVASSEIPVESWLIFLLLFRYATTYLLFEFRPYFLPARSFGRSYGVG